MSLKINLFSSWYSWKVAELALNTNHSLNILPPLIIFSDSFPVYYHAVYKIANLYPISYIRLCKSSNTTGITSRAETDFPSGASESPLQVFSGIRVSWSLISCVVFCRSLFVQLSFLFWPLCCLSFLFWPLCCLSFLDARILIIPLVSSTTT